jgi:hypothetical protein
MPIAFLDLADAESVFRKSAKTIFAVLRFRLAFAGIL